MRKRDYRIRTGHHTSVAGDTYLIRLFPRQTDQRWQVQWVEPELAEPPRPAELVEMQDGSILPNGDILFSWRFSYLTFGMYKYWNTTFLPGGVYSAEVTVGLYDDYDELAVYQAAMQHRFADDREKASGGYKNIIYRFVDGVKL